MFNPSQIYKQEDEATSHGTLDPFVDNMVFIEGGAFNMGEEQGDFVDEHCLPVHQVTLNSFFLCKHPVTQAEWKQVMGDNPSHFKGDDLPVEQVSWRDSKAFIQKLNSLTGKFYRLPSESEWEFAARGGNISKGFKYAGADNPIHVAWFGENSGNQILSGFLDSTRIKYNHCRTHSVEWKKANELGLFDMSGNICEWCEDAWHDNYNGAPDDGSAWVESQNDGWVRVLRGGC